MSKYIKHIRRLNVTLLTGATGFYLYSNTFGLDERKKKLELKINDMTVPIPPKLQSLIDEVMKDMKLKNAERSLIKPFLTGSVDLKHEGYLGGWHGVLLGLPHSFVLDNEFNVNFGLVVDDVEFPNDTSPSQALKSTICLSNEAKKFAVAHHLYESAHSTSYIVPVLPLVLIALISVITRRIEKGKGRMAALGSVLHFQLFLIGLWIFVFVHDFGAVLRECDADLKAACLGKSYIEGGIEYYEKMLERNKTIKSFYEKAPFDENGDINTDYLRTTHMSLLKRVAYLKDLLKHAPIKKELSAWNFVSFKEILHKSNYSSSK